MGFEFDVKDVVTKQIIADEELGYKAGGSGHMGHIGFRIESISDPVKKDVLMMYFRLFERENLSMIPEINFHRKIPSFEKKFPLADKANLAMRMFDKNGNFLGDKAGGVGGAFYNPLHPVWQEYVIKIITEMAKRYKGYKSFLGIDLRLNTNVSLAYPNLNWGYGDYSMALFNSETGIKVSGDPDSDLRFQQRYSLLTTQNSAQFISWRCKKIRAFHGRIAIALKAVRSDLKLYLGFMNIFSSHFDAKANLGWEEKFSPYEYLRRKGIDLKLYKDLNNIIVMRPRRESSFTYKLGRRMSCAYKKERTFSPVIDSLFKQAQAPTGLKIFNDYHDDCVGRFASRSHKHNPGSNGCQGLALLPSTRFVTWGSTGSHPCHISEPALDRRVELQFRIAENKH